MKNTVNLILLCSLLSMTSAACALGAEPAPDEAAAVPAEQPEAGEQAAASLMDQPLDGSSVEAFEAGLQAIKTEVGASEYDSVQGALKSMLFYNMGYRGKKEKLYQDMDGKTPNEIIAMAKR